MPRPGPWLAWVLVAGVALGVAGDIAAVPAWAAALAGASVALGVDRARVRRLAVIAALGCAAVGHGAAARDRALAPPLGAWFDAQVSAARADGPIDVIGAVAEDAAVVDDAVRLVVAASRLCDGVGECWPVGGTVQLRVTGTAAPAAAPAWTAGRAVLVPALLRQPDVHLNPGGPGETWQRLHRTADLVGTVKSAALVAIEPGPPWAEAAAAARRYVRRVAATYLAPRAPQSAAILAAILIGDRTGLDDDVVRELQAAGTYHVIAISGGNVALLAALCTFLLRMCLRSFRATAVVTTVIVVAYGWLVGSSASVDRAVLAASLYLTTSLVGLRPDGTAVLGLTALVLAIVDPLVTVDVGAWLSFGASLSIVIAAGRFMRWAQGHASAPGLTRPARASWIERVIWHPALALFSATLAAELALAPVAAAVFGRVGIAGLVLNFLAIPAMSLVEVAGFITMGLALVWDAGARASAAVTHGAAWLLVTSADVMAVAPWMSWRVPQTPIAWTAVYYVAAWIFVSRHDRRWPRVAAGLVALAALGVIVIAPGIERARPAPGWLRVTTLDVGQGDAIVVQFPSGRSLLVDAGGGPGGFDTGGRIVTPALWALGVRRLDYLIFTHPDLDHIGGAASVTRDLAPREIWEGVPVPRNDARRMLIAEADARDIAWRAVTAGDVVRFGSAELDVMNPPLPDWERQKSRNEDSIVLRLRFADVEIWLTGDAGAEFESRAVAARAFDSTAPLRVVKVGHHGSRSSSTPAFVSALDPRVALISVGRGNLFGHPAPDVVARYEQAGAEVFRTDRDAAISLETDGRDVFLRTWRGRTWVQMVRRLP